MSCDMDFSHCDGVNCPHGAPDDYHDCGDDTCPANGAELRLPRGLTDEEWSARVEQFQAEQHPPRPTA